MVTTTDESGRYELDGLTPGDCVIQVDMMAFAPVRRDWLASDVAPPLDFNLDLQGPAVAAASQRRRHRRVGDDRDGAAARACHESRLQPQSAATPQRGGRTAATRLRPPGGGFRNLNVNQTADSDVLAQMGSGQGDGAMNGAMGDNGASESF